MHELLVDPEWRPPEWRDEKRDDSDGASLASRVRETMERAFWDHVRDTTAAGLLAVSSAKVSSEGIVDPASAVSGLVAELREALDALLPASRRTPSESTLVASLSRNDVASVLSIAAREPTRAGATLGALVDGAAAMLRRAGAPAREADASRRVERLSSTLRETFAAAAAAAATGDFPVAADAVARAVVDALRFLHGELKTLKRDAGNAALSSMAPLARGAGGVEWARRRFAARRRAPADSPAEAIDALPRLLAWFAREVDVAHAMDASLPAIVFVAARGFERGDGGGDSRDAAPAGDSRDGVSAAPTRIRAGRGHASDDGTFARPSPRATETWRRAGACTPEGLFRLALASLAAGEEEIAAETLPETLEFDLARVDRARAEFRKIRLAAAWLLARSEIKRETKGSSNGGSSNRSGSDSLANARRRLDALLADPSSDLSDLAVELASSAASSAAPIDAAAVTAAETKLRDRARSDTPAGRELRGAILDAFRARLLVGPTRRDGSYPETPDERGVGVDSSSDAAAVRSAVVAATTRPLAAVGFVEEEAAAVADDVARLADGIMRGVGRVSWAVHGPYYRAAGTRLLEETDEL